MFLVNQKVCDSLIAKNRWDPQYCLICSKGRHWAECVNWKKQNPPEVSEADKALIAEQEREFKHDETREFARAPGDFEEEDFR